MSVVSIRKRTFDTSDPCGVAEELKALRLQIVGGGQAEVVRFGEDEVRYTRANLDALDREIARYEQACELTKSRPRRQRFAKRIRFI